MTFAINFDWSENFDQNTGEEKFILTCPNSEHHEKFGCGWETKYEATKDLKGEDCESYQGCQCCEDDSGYVAPMMNYIYPLDHQGLVTEETQIEIAENTNCVLVEENSSGDYYLALTGGGMDFSPSIAHAYMIAQKWLPIGLIQDLDAGWCKCQLNEKVFKQLREIIREQIGTEVSRFKEKKQKWDLPIKEITQ